MVIEYHTSMGNPPLSIVPQAGFETVYDGVWNCLWGVWFCIFAALEFSFKTCVDSAYFRNDFIVEDEFRVANDNSF